MLAAYNVAGAVLDPDSTSADAHRQKMRLPVPPSAALVGVARSCC
jgi:hypothetical protein